MKGPILKARRLVWLVTLAAVFLGTPRIYGQDAKPLKLTVELEFPGPFVHNEPIFFKVALTNVTVRDLEILPFGRATYPTWRFRLRNRAGGPWKSSGGGSLIGWSYHLLGAHSSKSLTYGLFSPSELLPGSYVASAIYRCDQPAELDRPPSWEGIVLANEVSFLVQAPHGVDADANNLLYGEVAKAEDKAREADPTRSDPYPKFARYRKCLELYPQSTYAKYCAYELADYPKEHEEVIRRYPRFCYTDDAQLKIAKYYLQGDSFSPWSPLHNPTLSEPQDLEKARTAAQKILELYPDGNCVEEAKKILAQIDEKLNR